MISDMVNRDTFFAFASPFSRAGVDEKLLMFLGLGIDCLSQFGDVVFSGITLDTVLDKNDARCFWRPIY
jgi:hypothetical protein